MNSSCSFLRLGMKAATVLEGTFTQNTSRSFIPQHRVKLFRLTGTAEFGPVKLGFIMVVSSSVHRAFGHLSVL